MNSSLKNKKILVVGATGFIGTNLVKELVKKGALVSLLVRSKKNLNFFLELDVKYFLGDLLDYKSLVRASRGIDIVFNASGALPYHNLSEEEYWKVNVDGVENLMKGCLVNKVQRVVHVSTVGIYGNVANNVGEDGVPNPSDVYSKSKLAGEEVVKKYMRNGLESVIVRPTIAYGPHDTRPVILTLFRMIRKRIYVQIGNGRNYFHTVYVDNLVDVLILAAIKKKAANEDFIVGDDPCPTFLQFSISVAAAMKTNLPDFYIPKILADVTVGILFKKKVDFVTDIKRYKTGKVRRLLGYSPKVDLKEGVERTFEWYKTQKLV